MEDCDALNIEHPEMLVKATDHIQEMAHFIAVLEEKGYAYQTDDGSLLLPHREVSRVRQAEQEGLRGHGPTARAWTSTSTTRTMRATSRYGRLPRRARRSGRPRSGRASGLAHRVLDDVDGIPGRDIRYSPRRRGPDLSASRERDRAIGGDDRQEVCQRLGAFALSAGRRREDVQVAGNFYTLRDLMLMGTSRRRSAFC